MTRTVKLMMRPIGNSSAARMIDAAPDDATKALEDLVHRASYYAQFKPELERLRATEAGAALIRQAEERNDAGE
jgi:hypothetical protein